MNRWKSSFRLLENIRREREINRNVDNRIINDRQSAQTSNKFVCVLIREKKRI